MNIIWVVDVLFEVLIWLIIVRCVLSFIRHDPYHPLIRPIYEITEPILAPFRRLMRPSVIDFSPIFAFLVLQLLKSVIIRILLVLL